MADSPDAHDDVVLMVGRVGRPHGVRGEVSVDVRTDEPDRRFVVGARLRTEAPSRPLAEAPVPPPVLHVDAVRWHQQRLLVRFDGIEDRNAAEDLRGVVLQVAVPRDETPADPEEFYDHQLEGLAVEDLDGHHLGEVVEVQHPGAQDLLVVRTPEGRDALVPFVLALVPTVDLGGGRVVVADRPGLVAPAED